MDTEEINRELSKALIQRLTEYGDDALGMTENQQKQSSQRKAHKTKDEIKTSRKKKKRKQTTLIIEDGVESMCDVHVKKKTKKQDGALEDTSKPVGLSTEVKGNIQRKPKVIEFVEPGRRTKKPGQPSSAQQEKTRKMTNNKVGKKRSLDPDVEGFKEIAREVTEFGVTGFSRKEQRKYEQQKAQALGAKTPKGQKMPYPILMYAKKIRQQRQQEQRELDKAMGMLTKKKKKTKKDSIPTRKHGHWVDGSAKGLEATVGRFKAGVQRISKADLKKVKSTKR